MCALDSTQLWLNPTCSNEPVMVGSKLSFCMEIGSLKLGIYSIRSSYAVLACALCNRGL